MNVSRQGLTKNCLLCCFIENGTIFVGVNILSQLFKLRCQNLDVLLNLKVVYFGFGSVLF